MTCPSSRKVYFAVTPSRQPNVSILFDGSLRVVTTPRKPKAGDIVTRFADSECAVSSDWPWHEVMSPTEHVADQRSASSRVLLSPSRPPHSTRLYTPTR